MKEMRPMKEKDYMMNREDIMEFLDIKPTYFTKLAREKAFPAFKVGREWRCRYSALLKWCDRQQENKPC